MALIALNTSIVAQPAVTDGSRIAIGKSVVPDTVEVGDPFTLVVSVVVPYGARVEWPSLTDTNAAVVMREPVRIVDRGEAQDGRSERAQYSLSAWNVGMLPIGLGDVVVRVGDDVRRISLSDARVFVRSVLPADTTLHVPKPARPAFLRETPWWERWWPALVVIAALALLWWFWRRRARSAEAGVGIPDPYEHAIAEFDRLERLRLIQSGESGRHVVAATEILRWYLDARHQDGSLALTSSELLCELVSDNRVLYEQLVEVLSNADGIKFARQRVEADRARELAVIAREIVEHFEQIDRANNEAVAKAEEDERRAREAEKKEAEEAARRASRKSATRSRK